MRASLHISPAALLKTFVGAVLYAVGFQFFMYPNSIVTGGVTGIAMIINFLTGLPVGAMTMVINIPLFLFSWKRFGGRFLLMSLIGMILASVLVDVFSTVRWRSPANRCWARSMAASSTAPVWELSITREPPQAE